VISVISPSGIPEVCRGADLASLLAAGVQLEDGDIVVLTSKVVSKSEGRVVDGNDVAALAGEIRRDVARRGHVRIVKNRLGLTMASAGIDASNVQHGRAVLLPLDPDGSAARIRAVLAERHRVNVGVLISDTAGRPWRHGQTDIAIGAAGVIVLESFVGREDGYGNTLDVTIPAAGDQLAGAAELASGKLGRRPFVVIRGLGRLVLPVDTDGPGADTLIRDETEDMFGFGAREAVVRALRGDAADQGAFGAPAQPGDLLAALAEVGVEAEADPDGSIRVGGGSLYAVAASAVAFAHGWTWNQDSNRVSRSLTEINPER
jgi:coenzyme F420-0:L-glutamate ligase/coenzyme F420-1:gamma-L-glutamate ligase